MNRPTTLVIAALAAGALFVAGCGGDDDDSNTTSGATGASGSSLTKEQFVAEADQICKSSEDSIRAEAEQTLGSNSSPQEITDFNTEVVVPAQQDVIDSIRALGAPEGDEEQVGAILDSVQSALDTVAADPEQFADPDAADREFDEADQLATDYGLKECGSD